MISVKYFSPIKIRVNSHFLSLYQVYHIFIEKSIVFCKILSFYPIILFINFVLSTPIVLFCLSAYSFREQAPVNYTCQSKYRPLSKGLHSLASLRQRGYYFLFFSFVFQYHTYITTAFFFNVKYTPHLYNLHCKLMDISACNSKVR